MSAFQSPNNNYKTTVTRKIFPSLAIALLLLLSLVSIGLAENYMELDQSTYGFGDQISLTIVNDFETAVTLLDPNYEEKFIGFCEGECKFVYSPRVWVQGKYSINAHSMNITFDVGTTKRNKTQKKVLIETKPTVQIEISDLGTEITVEKSKVGFTVSSFEIHDSNTNVYLLLGDNNETHFFSYLPDIMEVSSVDLVSSEGERLMIEDIEMQVQLNPDYQDVSLLKDELIGTEIEMNNSHFVDDAGYVYEEIGESNIPTPTDANISRDINHSSTSELNKSYNYELDRVIEAEHIPYNNNSKRNTSYEIIRQNDTWEGEEYYSKKQKNEDLANNSKSTSAAPTESLEKLESVRKYFGSEIWIQKDIINDIYYIYPNLTNSELIIDYFEVTDNNGRVYQVFAEDKNKTKRGIISSTVDVTDVQIILRGEGTDLHLKEDVIKLRTSKDKKIFAKTAIVYDKTPIKRSGIMSISSTSKTQTSKPQLEVIPEEVHIKRMVFKDVDPANLQDSTLYFEDVSSSVKEKTVRAYAIDPENISFTTAEISAVAKGTTLYKCMDWNYSNQECYGDWNKVMDIVPGQEYTFTITPKDPGFAEGLDSIVQVYSTSLGATGQDGSSGAIAINFDSRSLMSGDYSHDTVTNNNRVSILTDGTYKISYGCGWWEDSANGRVIMENWIRMNGVTTVTPSRQSCYIRGGATDQDRCSNSANLLADLTNGDYIELMGQRLQGATGTIRTNNDCWMYVKRARSTAIQVYDNAGGQNFDSAAITVNLDTTTHTNNTLYTLTADEVDITYSGWYKAYAHVCSESTGQNSRSTPMTWLELNSVPVDASYGYSYIRQTGDGDRNCEVISTMINPNSGDNLRVRHYTHMEEATGTKITIPDQSWLIVEKVDTRSAFVSEVTGGQTVGSGGLAEITFDTNNKIASPFSHTVGSSEIYIAKSGTYEVSYNLGWQDDAGNDRLIGCAYLKLNDGQIMPSTQCDMSRGDTEALWNSVSGTVVVNVSENDYIELEATTSGSAMNIMAKTTWISIVRLSDIEPPTVTLLTPANNSATYENTVSFEFNAVDDEVNVDCELWTNMTGSWKSEATKENVISGIDDSITISVNEGTFLWNIRCSDTQGYNIFSTSNRTISTVVPDLSTDKSNYLTADTASITGGDFPSTTNITINIKGNSGTVGGYPTTLITDGSGNFNLNWKIETNAKDNYSITAYQTTNTNIISQTTINVTELLVLTDKHNYLPDETVSITGTGFSNNVDVTVIVFTPFLDPMSGYPKTITTNSTGGITDSFAIGSNPTLGQYSLNITQDSFNSRTKKYDFEIVRAIIQGDKASYTQGDTINFTGYSWDPNTDVTVAIKNSLNAAVYGPINHTSNSTGEISFTWNPGYGIAADNYTISAHEESNAQKNDDYTFDIKKRPVGIDSDYTWYKNGETVSIIGTGFSPNNNVQVNIANSSGSISGYPKILSANTTGGVADSFLANSLSGNYTITGIDQIYSNLADSSTIQIVKVKAKSDLAFYGTGDNVILSGSYWTRNANVTVEINNSVGGLVRKINITADSDGTIIDPFAAPSPTGESELFYATIYNPLSPTERTGLTFTVILRATITTSQSSYYQNNIVDITGDYYTANGEVMIWIKDKDAGFNAVDYPKIITANSTGGISHNWNVGDFCYTNLTITTKDLTKPDILFAEKDIMVGGTLFTGDYEDFESGVFDATWSETENQAGYVSVTTTGTANNGSYHLQIRGTGNMADKTYNFQDKSISKLTLYAKANSFESGETAHIDIYDGSWQNNVFTWYDTDSDNIYHSAEIDINSFKMIDGFTVRFRSSMSGNADYFYVDDLRAIEVNRSATCTAVDSQLPSVHDLTISPESTTIGQPIVINVNATDDRGIRKTELNVTYPNGTTETITMSDDNFDGQYNATITKTNLIGDYTVAILAYDTSYNINSTTTGIFNITYANLELITDKQSYVRGETINILAKGFDSSALINITIFNSTNDTISGYPKQIAASFTGEVSDSWNIPGAQPLDTYTINITQASDTTRTVQDTFDVVTAVVYAFEANIEQGNNQTIYGYNWDPNVNVTLNISLGSTVIYGPFNVTTNSTGEFLYSWQLNYDQSLGEYTVFGIEPSNTEKLDTHTYNVIRRRTSVTTTYNWYRNDETASIECLRFSPNNNVLVSVYDSDIGIVSGYPKTLISNSTGGVSDSWFVSGIDLKNYTINCTDETYTSLTNKTQVSIVQETIDSEIYAYKSGEIVTITGHYWNRVENVSIAIYNSTPGLMSGYPTNVEADSSGYFSHEWTSQPGSGFGVEKYNITAVQVGVPTVNDDFTVDVTKAAFLTTNKNSYAANENVGITGTFYNQNGPVELWVTSPNGGTAKGHPITVTSTAIGEIADNWNTANFCEGDYYAHSKDLTYPELLTAEKIFSIDYRDLTSRDCATVWGGVCNDGPAEAIDNTFDTCSNGAGSDESVEDITINVTKVKAGDLINVTCTYDPYTSDDYLNIWYYNGTGWRRLYNEGPTGDAGIITRSVAFAADNYAGEHWVRCMIDYQQNTADECADTGSYYDNDDINFTVISSGGACDTFDILNPSVKDLLFSNNVYLGGTNTISANVTDDRLLGFVNLSITYPNGTNTNVTMLDGNGDDVFDYTITGLDLIGEYYGKIISKDDWGNYNSSVNFTFTVYETESPKWSGIRTSPVSPITYYGSESYMFNITWTDNYKLENVWIEGNFTGSFVNYSTADNGNEFYFEVWNLSAGTYAWQMHANDSSSNINNTGWQTFTININNTPTELLFNGTAGNISIEVFDTVNITGRLANNIGRNVELYVNNELNKTGTNSVELIESFNSLDIYNITLVHHGNRNYTGSSKTYYIRANDTQAPVLDLYEPKGTVFEFGSKFNISINASDNYQLDSVWLEIDGTVSDTNYNFTFDTDNQWYVEIVINETNLGRNNFTVFANDSLGNLASTNNSFYGLNNLNIITSQDSYTRNDTALISGSGFFFGTQVNITIINESLDIISGYPKLITSSRVGDISDSWQIPHDLPLGEYQINMTDITDNSRTIIKNISVVTAVILGDNTTYSQGDLLNISGYSWDRNSDVTIEIYNSTGGRIYGPTILVANDTGWIKGSWDIPYNLAIGSYLIYAVDYSHTSKNNTFNFNVDTRVPVIEKAYPWYKYGEQITLTGSKFGRGSSVSIEVRNNSGIVSGYPISVSTDSDGWFIRNLLVDFNIGEYEINVVDETYGWLTDSINMTIADETVLTERSSYKNGEIVRVSGHYWDRGENVTLFIGNSTLTFVDANVTANSDGAWSYSWTAFNDGLEGVLYEVHAEDSLDSSKWDNLSITVLIAATLNIPVDYFDQYNNVDITGSFYSPSSDVKITIFNNLTGAWINDTPYIVTATAGRDISYQWNTQDYCESVYTISTVDLLHPDLLYASTNFEIDYFNMLHSYEKVDAITGLGDVTNLGGSIANTVSSDNSYYYIGSANGNGPVNGFIELEFDYSDLELTATDRLVSMNLSMEYCYSGLEANPNCGIGAVPEGAINGNQSIEIWNYANSSWIFVDNMTFTGDDTEITQLLQFGYPAEDYTNGSMTKFRIEFDFVEGEFDDDSIIFDYLDLSISYKEDVVKPCTLVDDMIGEVSDINTTESVSVIVNNTPVEYVKDYTGTMNVSISNGSQILLSYEHNFNTSPINYSAIDLTAGDGSIAADIEGQDNITFYVPLIDDYCNVLICEGVMNNGGCNATNNFTQYPDPSGQYCLVIVNGTWAEDAPDRTDAMVDETSLTFSNSTPIEGENVIIQGTVYNQGNTKFKTLTVQFIDEALGIQIGSNQTISNLGPNGDDTVEVTWSSRIGTNGIKVVVDPAPPSPNGTYQEINETNNEYTSYLKTSMWSTFYGQIDGNLTLSDGVNQAYVWDQGPTDGRVYIADSDAIIDWTNLQSLGRTALGGVASSDFIEADVGLNTSDYSDNLTSTFSSDGSNAATVKSMDLFDETISNVPIVNSTNSSTFVTGILWDMSDDSNGEYDSTEEEDIVFVTEANMDTEGKYGNYDYEIKVPAMLREYDDTTKEVRVYVEII